MLGLAGTSRGPRTHLARARAALWQARAASQRGSFSLSLSRPSPNASSASTSSPSRTLVEFFNLPNERAAQKEVARERATPKPNSARRRRRRKRVRKGAGTSSTVWALVRPERCHLGVLGRDLTRVSKSGRGPHFAALRRPPSGRLSGWLVWLGQALLGGRSFHHVAPLPPRSAGQKESWRARR